MPFAFVTPVTRSSFFAATKPAACRRQPARPAAPRMVTAEPTSSTATDAPPEQTSFGRVITAMVTPFKRNTSEVDYSTAEQLAAHLAANGSDALVVAGTTGESPTLSWTEQYELFTVVRNAVGHRVKLIAGAGSNSTAEAVDATRRARRLDFDGTLQVVPYYNKPPQEGLYRHFRAIAEAEPDLPLMLYNVPSRTGVSMSPETVARLSDVANITGIKQATDNLEDFVEIRKATPSNFHIYSGDDALTLPFLALGATGVVSVASHIIGPQMQEMVRHYVEGRVNEATDIHLRYSTLFNDLFCMTNPIPTKTALRLMGWPVGGCRLPLTDATPEVEARLTALLTELGLM